MKTMRRDVLRKRVEAGRVELVGSYHFDDMLGESRFDKAPIPCAMMPDSIEERHKLRMDGTTCYLYSHDFTSGSGHAWVGENGIVTLYVHSNCHYTLRVK